MLRIKRHADAVIDRQYERLVPLTPVLDHGDVGGRLRRHHQHPFLRLFGHFHNAHLGSQKAAGKTKIFRESGKIFLEKRERSNEQYESEVESKTRVGVGSFI